MTESEQHMNHTHTHTHTHTLWSSSRGFGMFPAVFLFAALISASSGESSADSDSDSDTVVALVGQDVVLPCSFSSASSDFPAVEWSKDGLQPYVVFLYRDGCETHDMKHPDFVYRSSFISSELKHRNVSLRISNVQLSDAGTYRCLRLWKDKDAARDSSTVELLVSAASEPKLSVVSVSGGTVTLQCEARCWLPEPQIQFLDQEGTSIAAGPTERRQEASGCFTVTRTLTPQDATSRVTCRVHQAGTNQSRTAEILVPGGCSGSWSLSSSLLLLLLFLFLVLLLLVMGFMLLLLCCRRCRAAKRPSLKSHPSDQSVASSAGEDVLFLQDLVSISPERNVPDEQLRRRVLQLEKQLRDSEETIRRLLSSRPIICRPEDPVSMTTPRLHSLHDVLDLDQTRATTRGSVKKHSSVHRSASDSHAHPGPKMSALLRRHSSVLPSVPANHRFSYLDDLKEESEQLISESRKS